MKKILLVFIVLIAAAGILFAADSYSPKSKPYKNSSCPKNYTKKLVGSTMRCYENCRPGYRFKGKARYTRNGGVVSYMECVR